MRVGDYCKRDVVTVGQAAGLGEAARLMRDRHVGFLVVIEENDPRRAPTGVITDRDIVVQVNARDVDQNTLTVGDVMTRKPIVAAEIDDLGELMQGMRTAGVRRAPVVDSAGRLTGVIAVDDALDVITGLLIDICGTIRSEQRIERRIRAS